MKKIFYFKSKRIRFAEDPVWYICSECGTQFCNAKGKCPNCGHDNA